jgi:hypothetical protein
LHVERLNDFFFFGISDLVFLLLLGVYGQLQFQTVHSFILFSSEENIFSRAKKALNGNFYESLMQDEIQLLFLSFFPFFFIFMEMKKACAHLIQSCYSSDGWGKKKKATQTQNLTELRASFCC